MKRLLAPLAVGLAAWAQLANNPDAKILFGLERNDFIRAAILAAILVWMILGLAARTRASELARIVLNAIAGSPFPLGNPSACAVTDERGVARPVGPRCDIGAYEGAVPLLMVFLPLLRR